MQSVSGDLAPPEIVRLLNMQPHPEGGHFAETFRAPSKNGARPASSAIYYLLQTDELSAWHRIDANEVWLWHAGGPLALTISPPDGKGAKAFQLGADLRAGQRPQIAVPAKHWQTAESLGAWTLVSCTVSPGFQAEGHEMAPPNWRPDMS